MNLEHHKHHEAVTPLLCGSMPSKLLVTSADKPGIPEESGAEVIGERAAVGIIVGAGESTFPMGASPERSGGGCEDLYRRVKSVAICNSIYAPPLFRSWLIVIRLAIDLRLRCAVLVATQPKTT